LILVPVISKMRPSDPKLVNVKYVVTDDSAPETELGLKVHFLKVAVYTLCLTGATVLSLYFAGVMDGSAAVDTVTESMETVAKEGLDFIELDVAENPSCLSYSLVIEHCSGVTSEDIALYGCMSYVESTGGVCVSSDDNKCIVNSDCELVDTSLVEVIRLDDDVDSICESYLTLVDRCDNVVVEDISASKCMSYVEITGKVCVSHNESNVSCVTNDDCDLVDSSVLDVLARGPDPSVLAALVPGADPSVLDALVPGADPSELATLVPGADPSVVEALISGANPSELTPLEPDADPSVSSVLDAMVPDANPSDQDALAPGADPKI